MSRLGSDSPPGFLCLMGRPERVGDGIGLGHFAIHCDFGLALVASLLAYGNGLGRRPSPLGLGLFVLFLQSAIHRGFG